MALVGLVRVSTDRQEVQRQHDALDSVCVRVFEEAISGTRKATDRPGLRDALDYLRPGDLLTVQEVDRLGRNLLDGLLTLSELFQRGISVKVLDGVAAGEHTERSLILDPALALAEDRRRDISRKTKNGLDAAAKRGSKGGRNRAPGVRARRPARGRRRGAAGGQSGRAERGHPGLGSSSVPVARVVAWRNLSRAPAAGCRPRFRRVTR
ncbi:recombinase family protein [Actinopolyspora halophila]|uniref:recombinase family protein n=1 Tax=Actinopolyspora halophila TaxID=1850 RepID=UPI000380C37F|nr:recombinase family protein [Actinopolyspora halophila]